MGFKPIATERDDAGSPGKSRWLRSGTEKIHAEIMGQTYHAIWIHLIWGTKYRLPLIVPKIKFKLYDKLRDIARDKGYYLDFVNGVEDHVHLLVGLHPKFAIADVVKNLKGISHHWIRKNNLSEEYFHWQDGYAAISVSPDRVSVVRGYIRRQEQHHKKISFDEEWKLFEKQAIIFPAP